MRSSRTLSRHSILAHRVPVTGRSCHSSNVRYFGHTELAAKIIHTVEVAHRSKHENQVKKKVSGPARNRTWNLLERDQTRDPLRHRPYGAGNVAVLLGPTLNAIVDTRIVQFFKKTPLDLSTIACEHHLHIFIEKIFSKRQQRHLPHLSNK